MKTVTVHHGEGQMVKFKGEKIACTVLSDSTLAIDCVETETGTASATFAPGKWEWVMVEDPDMKPK